MSISTESANIITKLEGIVDDSSNSNNNTFLPLQTEVAKKSINHLTDKSESPVGEQTSTPPSEASKTDDSKPENGPTPPPSGTSSKAVPKKKIPAPIEQMFETFHQSPNGEFKPTFYNPFEVKHRRRTSRSQFKTLERAFMENCKPSATVRKALAQELNMSARSIQVWFQNRRAKLKTLMKSGKMTETQMMEYLAQEQTHQEQQNMFDDSSKQQDSPSSFEDSEPSDSESSAAKSGRSSFSVDRRGIPAGNVRVTKPVTIQSENMSFGNAYPNQSRNRSYSLPDIQRSPQLPFKQLQEALFGNSQNNNSGNSAAIPGPNAVNASEPAREYYNPSLNAFQHYFRASDAAMSRVSNNYNNTMAGYYAAAQNAPAHHINLPQLSIAPLAVDYQQPVDPNRFRPRSSSFAYGNRATGNANGNQSSYEMLGVIKEDSPISEYMSLPSSYTNNNQNTAYFDGHDHESSGITHQINSLDLDYFMASNAGGYQSNHTLSSCYSSSASASGNQSPRNDGQHSAYMHELAFLPQPSNEILLSTLIDDEHFLHPGVL